MSELTPAEIKFFETGELPPELAPEVTPPVETPPSAPAAAVALPTEMPPAVAAPDVVESPVVPPASPAPDQYAVLQRQLIEAESRRAATEQQLSDLIGQLQALQTAKEVVEVPDPNVDPFGHLQHQISTVNTAIQNLQANLTQQQQQAQQATQLQQFVQQVHSLRDEFVKTTPDFNDAYKHVRDMRAADLRAAGVSEHTIPQVLLQDEMTISQAAIAAGKNPAAAIYDMAKRHGYAGKPTTTTPPNPALAAAAARLAQAQAGQAAAVAPPRGAAEVVFTPETLKDASDTDLNKIVQSDDLWNKVAGGHASGKNIF